MISMYRNELPLAYACYFVGNFSAENKVNCLRFLVVFLWDERMCAHGVIRDRKCLLDRRNPYPPVAHTLDSICGSWKALCLWYVGYFEIKHFSVNATALQNLTSYKMTLAIIVFLLCVSGTLITSALLLLNHKHIKNSRSCFQEAKNHTVFK